VRRALPDDAEAVLPLRDKLADWLEDQGIRQWRRGEVPHSRLQMAIRDGGVYVVELENQVVASMTLQWQDPLIWGHSPETAGYIHMLVVDREGAGHGVGRHLLEWTEEKIRLHGPRLARLDVVRTNTALPSYDEGGGYRLVGYQDFPEIDWANVTALYEKQLL
jgi:ribosomal protein S18 acetylase RimI-like enzyme